MTTTHGSSPRQPAGTQQPTPSRFVPAGSRIDRLDRRITTLLARASVPFLRVALGTVFLWFGALKFFPGLSPAQDLAARTIEQLSFGLVGPAISLPVLAAWECLIGVGLLSGRFLRATLFLLAAQMVGTLTPLVLFPAETFTRFPIAPTLEGQYIIKNLV
ncbi:MAG: DoxX family protein, partial [Candidatus Limnocylindrales bacterium]